MAQNEYGRSMYYMYIMSKFFIWCGFKKNYLTFIINYNTKFTMYTYFIMNLKQFKYKRITVYS